MQHTNHDDERGGDRETAGIAIVRSLESQALDAEMQVAASALRRWQQDQHLLQTEVASRATEMLPPGLRKGVTNGTFSRWQNPLYLRGARFITVRAVVGALSHTWSDLAAIMDAAREEFLLRAGGADLPAQRLAEQRGHQEQERELVREWRLLDASTQWIIQMQVHSLALAQGQGQPLSERARAFSASAGELARPTDDPDAALDQALGRVNQWEQTEQQRADQARARRRRKPTASAGGADNAG